MARSVASEVERLYADSAAAFPLWEVTKDVVDEFIDLSLNYRQSGHPGGSRSKVHLLLALMLSGAMRHDLLKPWRPFGDRFIAGIGFITGTRSYSGYDDRIHVMPVDRLWQRV